MPTETEPSSEGTIQVNKGQPETTPGDIQEPNARPSVVPRMGPRELCAAKNTGFPSELGDKDEKKTVDAIVRSLKGETAHFDVFAREAEGTVMIMTMPLDDSVMEELGIKISADCYCGHSGAMSVKAKLELYADDEQIKDRPIPTKVEMPMAALETFITAERQQYSGPLSEDEWLAVTDEGWYKRDASKREQTVLARGFSTTKDTADIEVTVTAPSKQWCQCSEKDHKPQSIKVKVPHWHIRFDRPAEKSYEPLPLLTGPSFSTKTPDGYLIDCFPKVHEKFSKHGLELLSDTKGLPFREEPSQQGSSPRYLHHVARHDSNLTDHLLRLTAEVVRHFTPVHIGKLVELTIPIKSEMDGISTENLRERFGTACLGDGTGGDTWATVLENQDGALPDGPLRVSLVSWPGLGEFFTQHKETGESNLGKAPSTLKPSTSLQGRYMSREDDTLTVYSAGNISPEDHGLHTLVPATFMWDDADRVTHKQVKLVRMTVYDTATCHASTHWGRDMLTELEKSNESIYAQFQDTLTART